MVHAMHQTGAYCLAMHHDDKQQPMFWPKTSNIMLVHVLTEVDSNA